MAQQDFAARIGEACARYDIPYVFELLVYPLPGEKRTRRPQYIEMADKKSDLVLESVRDFADPKFGVDLFKVESPVPAREVADPAIARGPGGCSTRWAGSAAGHG